MPHAYLRLARQFSAANVVLMAYLLFAPGTSSAADYSWNSNGTNGQWSNSGNWTPIGPPANDLTTDTVTFNAASYAFQPNAGSTSIAGITVGSSSAALTISGTSLSIGAGGFTIDSGANAVSLSPIIVSLGADQIWTNNSASLFTVASTVSTGSFGLTIAGTGNTTVSSGIIGAGGLVMNGSGTLTMNGALSAGNTTVNAGILALTASGSILVSGTSGVDQSLTVGNGVGTNGTLNISGGTVTLNYGANNANLNIGLNSGSGIVNMSSGAITATASSGGGSSVINLGFSGGTGTFTQTGGNVNVNQVVFGDGTGTYNLNGGALQIGGENGILPGTGTYVFNLGGGTIQVIGSDLTTTVNASLTANTYSIIDTNGMNATFSGAITGPTGGLAKISLGTLSLTGASNTIGSFLILGGNVSQTTGTLTTSELAVGTGAGNTASYTMSGGSLIFPAGTPPPLVGGSASSFRVGDFGGTATFTQTGGSISVDGSMNIGNQGGNGTYNISGGTLLLTDGLFSLGRTTSSSATASVGLMTISGTAAVTVTPGAGGANFIIGDRDGTGLQGVGTLTQTGGTFTINAGANLFLAGYGNSNVYNLNGGTLQVGGGSLQGNYGSSGTYSFNLGGGIIQVIGSDLSTSVNASLTANTYTTIDTNGMNATFSGAITGSTGGLAKISLGTLSLTGASNTIGSFLVAGGNVSQTTGTLTTSELAVGTGAGNTASYTMSGGSLIFPAGTPPAIVGGSASSFRVGDFGGTGTFTQTGGSISVDGSMNIGNQGGNGTYNISGGTLLLTDGLFSLGRTTSSSATASVGLMTISGTAAVTVTPGAGGANFIIGDRDGTGLQGVGTLTQTGGTFTINAGANLFLAGYGNGNVYNLNGGTLQVGGGSLQGNYGSSGTYTFNLGGGIIQVIGSDLSTSVNASLTANTYTTIDTNGMNATFSGAITGSTGGLAKISLGTLSLTGAINTIGSFLILGGNVSQTTGSLTTSELAVGTGAGNTASYTMSGGSLIFPAGTPPAIVGGSASSFRVGDFGGTGTFTQTGGSISVDGSMNIGNQGGNGTYNISGGTLLLTDGLFSLGRTTSSSATASVGLMTVSGTAAVTVTPGAGGANFIIGDRDGTGLQGVGTLTQTGGTFTINAGANLFLAGYGNGNVYNLNGGTLQVGGGSLQGNYGSSGTYSFNLGGGIIQVIGSDLSTSVNASLTANTYTTIDTNGMNATFSGAITGSTGGLAKISLGTLSLTGASNTIGSFLILGGNVSQTTGTLTTSELAVGTGAGNTASYTMSGGSLIFPAGTPPAIVGGSASSFRVGDFGGTGTFTQTGGSISVDGSMNIGNQGGNGTYAISGGTLSLTDGLFSLGRTTSSVTTASVGLMTISGTAAVTVSSGAGGANFIIGDRDGTGLQGVGTLTQTGGTFTINANANLFLAGYGNGNVYNLNGGTLQVGGSSLQGTYGGSGTYSFNLGGGTIQVIGSDLTTSVNASLTANTYSIIDTNGMNVNWSGSITGSSGQLVKINPGTLTLSTATSSIGSLLVTGGNVTQTSGTLTTYELAVGTGAGNTASYTMSGGSLIFPAGTPPAIVGGTASSFRVGDFGGTGTFTQTGGSISVDGSMNIGNQGGNGTYNISGGTLLLTDGLFSIGRTTSSVTTASVGLMTISGTAVVTVTPGAGGANFIIGDRDGTGLQGVGTLTQTGGTFTINTNANLFLAGYGTGNVYNLNGGTLQVGGSSLQGNYGGSGTYSFNLGGGTIQVIGSDLTTGVNLTLTPNTFSTIDTNGFNATLSSSINSPAGGLIKLSPGTLNLSASGNTIASLLVAGGNVSQSAGTLTTYELAVGTGAGNTASYTLSGGSIVFPAGTPPPLVGGSASSFRVGDFGGTGTFTQTGGSISVDGSMNIGNQGGNGTYNISGGTLLLTDGLFSIGRTTSSAATASVGLMTISGTAAVTVSPGAGGANFIIGDRDGSGLQGVGTLTQTGGTFTINANANLFLAGYGNGNVYNLNGGTLQVGGSSLQGNYGGSGTYSFNLGGGTIQVIGSDLTTSVNASLTANTYSIIDTNGMNVNWSGSITGSSGQLVKINPGTLTLSTATSSIGSLLVTGGNVTQTSGTLTTYELAVGTGAGNTASYTMSGGSLIFPAGTPPPIVGGSASSFRVGDFGGTGTFTQTGGSISVDGSMNIGNQGGNGTYNISGGTLLLTDGLFSLGRTTSSSATASVGLMTISGTAAVTVTPGAGGANFIIGDRDGTGLQGVGTLTQTGGTFTINAGANLFLAGYGNGNVYNLNGGTLQVGGGSLQGNYGSSGTYTFNLGGGIIQVIGSDLSTSVNASLTANTYTTIDTNGMNATFSGAITGSTGGLAKISLGTLSLTGAINTIGSFLILGGNVSQTTGSLTTSELAVGTGAGNTASYTMSGGSLIFPAGTPPAIVGGSASSFRVGDFGGTGTFTQTGGSISVDGSMNIGNQGGNGTYNISGGTLLLTDGLFSLGRTTSSSATASVGLMTISGTAAVMVTPGAGGANFIIGDRDGTGLQGVGTLTQTGGTFTINTGANLFLAGYGNGNVYNLNGGTLQVGGGSLQGNYGSSGTYSFNLGGGTIQVIGSDLSTSVNATLTAGTSTIDTQQFNATLNGSLSGGGGLSKIGAGTLILNNINSYIGSTSVNAGALVVSSTATLGSGPLMVNNTNPAPSSTDVYLNNTAGQTVGSLSSNLTGAASGNAVGIFLGAGVTLTVNQTTPTTFQGTIFGGGSLVLGSSSTSTLTLSGTSTYGGSTTINGGTIQLGATGGPAVTNVLPTTTSLTLGSGGTLNLNNNDQTIAALNSSAGNINTGSGAGGILTVGNTAGGTVTYNGAISGTGGLTWGIINTNVPNPTPSTLVLTNASTNTGPMTINSGILSIGTAYALSGGVAPVLPYNASNSYPGPFTLGPTATLLTNGFNLTVGSLGGGGPIGGNINLGNNSSSTLYIVVSSPTGYAGVVSGTGNVYIANGDSFAIYGNWTLTGGVTHDVTTLGANHNDSPQSYLPFATSGSLVSTQGIDFAGFTDQVSTIYGGSAGDNNGKGTFVDATGDAGKLVLSYYAASVANGGPANGSGGTQNFSGFFANDVGLIFDAGYFGNAQQLTLSGPNNTTGPLTIGFTNQTTPQNGAATGAQSGVMNQVIISATSTFGAVTVGNLAVSNLVNNLTVQPTGNLTAASVTIGDAFAGSTGNNSVTVGGTLTTGSVSIGNTNLYGTNVLTILSTGTVMASGAITIGNDFATVTGTLGTLNVNGALGTTSAPVTSLSVQAGGVLAGYGTINTATNPINVTNGTIRGGFDDGVNQLGTLSIAASSGTTAKAVLTIQGSGSSGLGQTGAIMTEVLATSSAAATNSKINITGANNALNLNTTSGGGSGQINIVLYDPTASLTPGGPGGATYTFVLATVATAGRIQLGGLSAPAGTPIDNGATLGAGSGSMGNADLYITGASTTYMNSVTSWSLFIDSTGRNLELSVTSATPEPEHILLMCVGVLLAGFAIRRRWRRMGLAASVA